MSVTVSVWNEDKTKQEVSKRYRNACKERVGRESNWKRNERTIYSSSNLTSNIAGTNNHLDYSLSEALSTGIDQSNADVNVAYAFKNFRFIHAQMSANPPAVAMRPTSSDQDDHRKADAADRLVRWALRKYGLQEKQDLTNLNCLLYGTGFIKAVWDSTKGDIIGSDADTGEVQLEGDIRITVPSPWNIYIDPDARCWDEVQWVIEKIFIDYEEACHRWPDKKDILEGTRVKENENSIDGRESELRHTRYNSVQLLEYWETGLPVNGFLGRKCITTTDGETVEECGPSPHRFRMAGSVSKIESIDLPDEVKEALIAKIPEQALLPFHMLSDIDVADTIYGMSSVEYVAQLQENLSRLDSSTLDSIQAAGVPRLILPESAEISDDSLSDSPWDVIKITGNQPPYWQAPAQMMPEMTATRQNYIQGINDVMGVNESMFGQQSREQAAAAMQYATNQGNMVRRRLFNKYVLQVEGLYKTILDLIRKHWTVNRTIKVLGKEKALESIDIKGADIDGGYDIIGEYGVTLSLDPISRREEILSLQPLFEKAGVPARTSMKMLKLNELESMFDALDLAENRQKEIFDAMIATGAYIAPKKFRDHENMIAWALQYFMTQEFESLADELQALCEKHIEERIQLAAMEKSGGAAAATPPQPGPPGPAPEQPAGSVPPPAGLPPIQNG